jgi:formamidopyrimidine-DNA glycosylase
VALDDGARLVLHLGMTGQLFSGGRREPAPALGDRAREPRPEEQLRFRPDAHTHLRFEFEDGGPEVYFRDTRKFGKVFWLASGEAHPAPRAARHRRARDRRRAAVRRDARAARAIKSLLLDQSISRASGTSTRTRRCSSRACGRRAAPRA